MLFFPGSSPRCQFVPKVPVKTDGATWHLGREHTRQPNNARLRMISSRPHVRLSIRHFPEGVPREAGGNNHL